MTDIFDKLSNPEPEKPRDDQMRPALFVTTPCVNNAEYEARARCHEEIARANIPDIFEEEDGSLGNSKDFPPEVETVEEAYWWREHMLAPIIEKHQLLIDAARALGPDKK